MMFRLAGMPGWERCPRSSSFARSRQASVNSGSWDWPKTWGTTWAYPSTRSSIVTVPVVDGAQVREALGARRIKTSGRGHEVRVSFHLYNDDSDVANVAEVLLPFVRI